MRRLPELTIVAAAALAIVLPAQAQDSQTQRLQAALASPARPDADKARDAARRPIQVVQFLGIENGDTILELIASGGWYTQVLSAAVGSDGHVYAQNPPRLVSREGFVDTESELHNRLGNVSPVHGDVADAGIDGQIDVVLTALNLHDIYNRGGDAAAIGLLNEAFNALRSGGVMGVIDHHGVAGQPNADLHRMEQAVAEDLLESVGFVIDATSDILANPADNHMLGSRDDSLGRNSDRFLIRARKP